MKQAKRLNREQRECLTRKIADIVGKSYLNAHNADIACSAGKRFIDANEISSLLFPAANLLLAVSLSSVFVIFISSSTIPLVIKIAGMIACFAIGYIAPFAIFDYVVSPASDVFKELTGTDLFELADTM